MSSCQGGAGSGNPVPAVTGVVPADLEPHEDHIILLAYISRAHFIDWSTSAASLTPHIVTQHDALNDNPLVSAIGLVEQPVMSKKEIPENGLLCCALPVRQRIMLSYDDM